MRSNTVQSRRSQGLAPADRRLLIEIVIMAVGIVVAVAVGYVGPAVWASAFVVVVEAFAGMRGAR